jgi:hypothetical protein
MVSLALNNFFSAVVAIAGVYAVLNGRHLILARQGTT